MSERQRYEKDEKVEKREEKDEKERQEKTWEEKYHRDPLSAIIWPAILIWAGLALLADNLGLLARIERLDAWDVILMGAGAILLVEAGVRLVVPAYRRPVMGTVILGLILIAVGLGEAFSWTAIGPLILIAVGVAILARTLMSRH